MEQNISESDDLDGKDSAADHFVGYFNREPIAAARVRYINERAKIERVAVLSEHRGQRYGFELMQAILAGLQTKEEVTAAYLESQSHAKSFYERLGFEQIGAEFGEVGIPHVAMIKKLK